MYTYDQIAEALMCYILGHRTKAQIATDMGTSETTISKWFENKEVIAIVATKYNIQIIVSPPTNNIATTTAKKVVDQTTERPVRSVPQFHPSTNYVINHIIAKLNYLHEQYTYREAQRQIQQQESKNNSTRFRSILTGHPGQSQATRRPFPLLKSAFTSLVKLQSPNIIAENYKKPTSSIATTTEPMDLSLYSTSHPRPDRHFDHGQAKLSRMLALGLSAESVSQGLSG